jgi:uncharacterized membrane protein YvlD (DUF360 family)
MNDLTKRAGERRIAHGRIAWIVCSLAASGVLTYFFRETLTNKPEVLGVVAAIFSILAAVLIAVISILGDPSMLLDQSWRHSYLSAQETQRKIHRQTDVFIIYVLLLVSLFAFMICPNTLSLYAWLQGVSFFLTVLAFLASLTLPFILRSIQRDRLDRVIKSMKGNAQNGST